MLGGIALLRFQIFLVHGNFLPYGFGSMMAQFFYKGNSTSPCTLRRAPFLTSNLKKPIRSKYTDDGFRTKSSRCI